MPGSILLTILIPPVHWSGEATAIYKSKDSRREFRTSASLSNVGVFANGRPNFDAAVHPASPAAFSAAGSAAGSDDFNSRRMMSAQAGRSQSFNESQSVMRREAIINRPLPSPPIERFSQVHLSRIFCKQFGAEIFLWHLCIRNRASTWLGAEIFIAPRPSSVAHD
jgi:hypothetical protein